MKQNRRGCLSQTMWARLGCSWGRKRTWKDMKQANAGKCLCRERISVKYNIRLLPGLKVCTTPRAKVWDFAVGHGRSLEVSGSGKLWCHSCLGGDLEEVWVLVRQAETRLFQWSTRGGCPEGMRRWIRWEICKVCDMNRCSHYPWMK